MIVDLRPIIIEMEREARKRMPRVSIDLDVFAPNDRSAVILRV